MGNGSAAATGALGWLPRNTIVNTVTKTVTETHMHTKVNVEKQVQAPGSSWKPGERAGCFGRRVGGCDSYGVLTSRDQGASWQGGPVMGEGDYLSVAVHGDRWRRLGPMAS